MGKKVLLIEDEPNIIEAISFILKRDGCGAERRDLGIQYSRGGAVRF